MLFSSFTEASHLKALLYCLFSHEWISVASDMGYMLSHCEAKCSAYPVNLPWLEAGAPWVEKR